MGAVNRSFDVAESNVDSATNLLDDSGEEDDGDGSLLQPTAKRAKTVHGVQDDDSLHPAATVPKPTSESGNRAGDIADKGSSTDCESPGVSSTLSNCKTATCFHAVGTLVCNEEVAYVVVVGKLLR